MLRNEVIIADAENVSAPVVQQRPHESTTYTLAQVQELLAMERQRLARQ